MLSRVADSLFWMSRYLERAEHTARLLDVNLALALEQSSRPAEQRVGTGCSPVCTCRPRPTRSATPTASRGV